MRKTVDVLGIPVDALTMKEAVEKVGRFIEEGGTHAIYTPNAEIIMQAQRDPELKEILMNADMLTADGAGVVLASRILGRELPEKVSGVDLVQEIFRAYAGNGLRVFLFGAKPGVAEEAAVNIIKDNPGIVIAGCRNGYFSDEECDEIIAGINRSSPDILRVWGAEAGRWIKAPCTNWMPGVHRRRRHHRYSFRQGTQGSGVFQEERPGMAVQAVQGTAPGQKDVGPAEVHAARLRRKILRRQKVVRKREISRPV